MNPAKTGVITANFTVGDRVGPQLKQIRVRARSDQADPHVLTFKTNIPIFAKVQPQFVYWANGEPPTPKSMIYELVETSTPIEKLTAVSNNPAIRPEVRELEKGRRYEIAVTPGATENFFSRRFNSRRKPAVANRPASCRRTRRSSPGPRACVP